MRTRDAVGGLLPRRRAARRAFWLALLACGIAASGLGCATFGLAAAARPSGRSWFETRIASGEDFPYEVHWRVRGEREFPGDSWFAPHGTLTIDAPIERCDRLELVRYRRDDYLLLEPSATRVDYGHFNGQSGPALIQRLLRAPPVQLDSCDVLLVGDKAPNQGMFLAALDREGRELARSQAGPRTPPPLWAWPLIPVAVAFDVVTSPIQVLLIILLSGHVRG
jgi:hypothetical protein